MAERSAWIPGGVLALGCLLTLATNRQVRMPLALPLDSIPLTLAGRPGKPGTIPRDQERAAGVSSYIYRWYAADSAPFEVYAGYYDQQTQGKTIHSPKNCLPGSGWEALNQSTTTVQTSLGAETVNRYLLQNQQQRALVFYWYQGRGRVESNEYRVKWELLRDSALRGRSEEALVRIVVYLNARTTEAQASEWASRVAADLIPAMGRVLPRW